MAAVGACGARSTLDAGAEDLALETVTAYLQVARSSETLDATHEWRNGLSAIAAMTDQIQRIDRGRQFDNALANSRVQRADAEILTRTTSLAEARAGLAGLVGRPVEVVSPRGPWDTAVPENLEGVTLSHPRMKVAEATIEVAREQSALDQLYDRPTVSVEAFASSGKNVNGQFRAVNNVGLQLVGNVSLLDGGAGAATSKASLVRLVQAERARDAVHVELLTALTRLRSLLEGGTSRSETFDLAYRQAVGLAARMREQFQAGRRPLVDLLAQETEIYQMKLNVLGERFDHLLSQARMAHASGRLLPDQPNQSRSVLEIVRANTAPPVVILITGDPSQALEAYESAVADYIVKPVRPARLAQALERAEGVLYARRARQTGLSFLSKSTTPTPNQWLSGSRGRDVVMIEPMDIIYLQAERKYTTAVLPDGHVLMRYGITDIEAKLDMAAFLRIHRSTIVNVKKIDFLRRDEMGRLRIHMKGRPEGLIVSRTFEYVFKGI